MWHLLEQHEMKRLSRGRAAARRGPRPRPTLPAGTDLLPQIRHIVVLMMENHSYDNYLGMLQGRGDGFPMDPGGQPGVFNRGADGEIIRAFRLPSPAQRHGVPSQSWQASHLQWGEGRNGGSWPAPGRAVGGHEGAFLDVDTASEAAAVGSFYWTCRLLRFRPPSRWRRWFSSCLGPTFPNRRFLIAGTAHGLIADSPYDLLDYLAAGTIFDLLTEHGISWVNYHPVASEQSRWRHYARHKHKMARRRVKSAVRSLPAVTQGTQKDLQFTADVFPFGIGRYMQHVRGLGQFFADADNGTLPAFSIVDPDFNVYSEENPQDIRKGESFAAEVINRVLHGKGWQDTLLIWVYDEHGGYYDHVPPPPALPPDDIEGPERDRGRGQADGVPLRRSSQSVKQKNLDQGPDGITGTGSGSRRDHVAVRAARVCLLGLLDHTSVLKLVGEMEPAR